MYLGAWKHVGSLGSSDTLNSKIIGSYTINVTQYGTPEGLPENNINMAFLLCFGGGQTNSWGLQILYELSSISSPRIWYRTYTSSAYGSWLKIYQKS